VLGGLRPSLVMHLLQHIKLREFMQHPPLLAIIMANDGHFKND
jgi:hypothetical protein